MIANRAIYHDIVDWAGAVLSRGVFLLAQPDIGTACDQLQLRNLLRREK